MEEQSNPQMISNPVDKGKKQIAGGEIRMAKKHITNAQTSNQGNPITNGKVRSYSLSARLWGK